ncbi:Hypothetical protein CINCED_3A005362 [Cinara cedri]|uniref:Uncharacterized protein n=1 Tax=Cinara cedri TaxID=506608 RepID=A0A5E4MVH9_9HEMI|nr:Hypothetical protein CINCED_3A005362 [Cinara cedri]
MYVIGTKEGNSAQTYSRNQFKICKEKFMSKEGVPDVTDVPGNCRLLEARGLRDVTAKENAIQENSDKKKLIHYTQLETQRTTVNK